MGILCHIDDDEKEPEEHSMLMHYEEPEDDDHTFAISKDDGLHREDDE
jgi:hypothetical protein